MIPFISNSKEKLKCILRATGRLKYLIPSAVMKEDLIRFARAKGRPHALTKSQRTSSFNRCRLRDRAGLGSLYLVPTPNINKRDCNFSRDDRRSYHHQLPKDEKDYEAFYSLHRPLLKECYKIMKIYHHNVMNLISIADFVELLMRSISSSSMRHFWGAIASSFIVVQDPHPSAYPCNFTYFLRTYGTPGGVILRQLSKPIEIISHALPEEGWSTIYCDGGFVSGKKVQGGGIVVVDSTRQQLDRVLPYFMLYEVNASFESEFQVLIASAEFALMGGMKRTLFRSDCLDLVEVVNAQSFVQPAYKKYYCQLLDILRHFEAWKVEYIPREGNKLADEIAKCAWKASDSWADHFRVKRCPNLTSQMEEEKLKLELEMPSFKLLESTPRRSRRYAPRHTPTT